MTNNESIPLYKNLGKINFFSNVLKLKLNCLHFRWFQYYGIKFEIANIT